MAFEYGFDGNGNVIEYSRQLRRTVPASTVLKKLMDRLGYVDPNDDRLKLSPPLPRGTRFYWEQNNSRYFLVEQKPGINRFAWNEFYIEDLDATSYGGEYQVSMPWQYFLFKFNRVDPNKYGITDTFEFVKLFWAKERLVDFNSQVFNALLPNIDGSSAVCLGDIYPEGGSDEPIWVKIEQVVDNFYESDFNNDLGWQIPYREFVRYEEEDMPIDWFNQVAELWQAKSRQSLLCYQEWAVGTTSLAYIIRGDMPREIVEPNPPDDLYTLLYQAVAEAGVEQW